jgi:hypothetical protein
VLTAATNCAHPSDAYRRQARRLRCHFARQPAMLQLALEALAKQAGPAPQPAAVSSATAGSARQFAEYLADRTPSAVLRYSERLELIRTARRFGIDRFEANLLIASVLERHRRHSEEPPAARGGGSLLGGITVFLVVQSAVVLGAWWTVFR